MKSLDCVVKSEGDLKVCCVGETIVGFVELVGMSKEVMECFQHSITPDDSMCQEAYHKMKKFADECIAVLYCTGSSLDDVFSSLEERALVWNSLSYERKEKLLQKFKEAVE